MLRSQTWLALSLVATGASVVVAGCDWDTFDPRLGAPATGGGGGVDPSAGGSGGDSSDGGGATTGVGAGGPTDCGRISLVSDAFDGTELDDVKWDPETSSGSLAVAGGNIDLTLGTGSQYGYSRIRSEYFYDMRNASVAVEVVTITPSIDSSYTLSFFASADGDNNAELRLRGDQLQALRRRNGATDVVQSVTYSPTNHRWWRLRHDGNTVYYEFSSDGTNWGVLAEVDEKYVHDFSSTQVIMGSSWSGLPADMMARTASIGQLLGASNPGVPDTGGWCKAERLVDDFTGAQRKAQWKRSGGDSGSFAFQYEGEVFLGLDWGDDNAYYEYRSAQPVDLRDSAVSVEMLSPVDEPEGRTFLEVVSQGEDDEIELSVVAGIDDETMMETVELRCIWRDDGNVSEVCPNVAYDANAHRFFRLREASGSLYWEVSADGTTYAELGRLQQHPFALEDFWVRFGGSADTNVISPPPEVRFDHFNVAPGG